MTQEEIKERSKAVSQQLSAYGRKIQDAYRRKARAIERVEAQHRATIQKLHNEQKPLEDERHNLQRQCDNRYGNGHKYYGMCEYCGLFYPQPDPDEGNQAHM